MPYEYLIRYAEPAAPSTYYYASTLGRATLSGDTPSSTQVPGGVQPLSFQLSLFGGVDPVLNPNGLGGFGVIKIADATGDLDYLIGKVMVGGTLTILRGTPGALYSTFTTVATMTTAGLLYDQESKTIRVRDFGWYLDTPLHDNRYAGTGGVDGDANIKNQIKPYRIGTVFNCKPILIEASKLIYQLTDGVNNTISAVRDGGIALSVGTSRADYAAMAASAPAAGYYDRCSSLGLIRLGASPFGDITVDFTGDSTGGGSAYLKRADIAQRIATRAGTTISVNAASVTALNSAQAATCGFSWDSEISKRQALVEVMQGCLGYFYVNLSGELVLGYLVAPTGTAAATYTWPQDFAEPPTQIEDAFEPRYKTTLGFQRNYLIQEKSTLAGAAGSSLNVIPTLIDSAKLIYQLTDPRTPTVSAISAVRDGGSPLTVGTSRADYAALAAAAAPAAGTYDYALTSGLIRLGSAPSGDLVADFTGAVSEANAQLYAQDGQWTTAETSSQRTNWPTSAEVKLFSGYYASADAATEASRQQTLFQGIPTGSRNLERIRCKLFEDPFVMAGYLGQVISIAGYTRYSWTNPRKFLVIGVEFAGDATTTVTLWG